MTKNSMGAFARFGFVLAASAALAACGGDASQDVVEEEGIPGLSVKNARMVLGAVEGNPAAVYFDLNYEGDRGLTIRRADVANAESAMLHTYGEYDFKVQMMEALPIGLKKGTQIEFKPGDYHIMAFNVSPEVVAGGTNEVTLTVSGGDTYTFEADVVEAGDER